MGNSSLPVRLVMCVIWPHGTSDAFFRLTNICLGYQRERGAGAQLGQDARVRSWHHR